MSNKLNQSSILVTAINKPLNGSQKRKNKKNNNNGNNLSNPPTNNAIVANNPRGNFFKNSAGAVSFDAVPSAFGHSVTTHNAKITQIKGGIRVEMRELVTSLISTGAAFLVKIDTCQPGLWTWLKAIASNYQFWRAVKLEYEVISSAGTGAPGDNLLGFEYDASTNSGFPNSNVTETELSEYKGSVEANVWKDMVMRCDPKYLTPTWKYTRGYGIAGDIKTFDGGYLLWYCSNLQSTTIGKLYRNYIIELAVPQSPVTIAEAKSSINFSATNSAGTITFTTTLAKLISLVVQNDPIGFGSPTAGVFTPGAGVYKIDWYGNVYDATAENFTATLGILKNGANVGINSTGTAASYTGATGEVVNLSGSVIVTCNGTDTISLAGLMTGSTGPLTIPANQVYLNVSLA